MGGGLSNQHNCQVTSTTVVDLHAQLANEASKPANADDLENFEDAKAEVARLRKQLSAAHFAITSGGQHASVPEIRKPEPVPLVYQAMHSSHYRRNSVGLERAHLSDKAVFPCVHCHAILVPPAGDSQVKLMHKLCMHLM